MAMVKLFGEAAAHDGPAPCFRRARAGHLYNGPGVPVVCTNDAHLDTIHIFMYIIMYVEVS